MRQRGGFWKKGGVRQVVANKVPPERIVKKGGGWLKRGKKKTWIKAFMGRGLEFENLRLHREKGRVKGGI